MIAIIKNNSITYPTDVYLEYNLYLIDEYTKFALSISQEQYSSVMKNRIISLEELIEDNTIDKSKIFNIMDWEENLVHHYNILNSIYKHKKMKSLVSIESFLRKCKLQKINRWITV